jgi:hypothetical protein
VTRRQFLHSIQEYVGEHFKGGGRVRQEVVLRRQDVTNIQQAQGLGLKLSDEAKLAKKKTGQTRSQTDRAREKEKRSLPSQEGPATDKV